MGGEGALRAVTSKSRVARMAVRVGLDTAPFTHSLQEAAQSRSVLPSLIFLISH